MKPILLISLPRPLKLLLYFTVLMVGVSGYAADCFYGDGIGVTNWLPVCAGTYTVITNTHAGSTWITDDRVPSSIPAGSKILITNTAGTDVVIFSGVYAGSQSIDILNNHSGLLTWDGVSNWVVDIYVANSALGTATGQSPSDAIDMSTLNTWAGVVPGQHIHFVGLINTALTIGGSGAVNRPITMLWEPGARFTSGVWPGGSGLGAISGTGKSWITIDGQGVGII